ncbi:MAG: hypothetical protein OXH15_09755 [Gammaproteobacteria bacterium]|nr:hypothetical protein [Gammaproteobacteria bacterium]
MSRRTGIALLACAGASLVDVSADAAKSVSEIDSCRPTAGALAQDATLVGAQGRYRLVLVARTGGRRVSGVLVLAASPPAREVLGSASTPLQGSTDIDLGAVGAHRIGDPASTDPHAPGVLVLESERRGTRQILLRLGSDANRVDRRLYDGGHTVLRVQQIDADGFAGRWESRARSSGTGGTFCATRL